MYCKTKFDDMQSMVDHKQSCELAEKYHARVKTRVIPRFFVNLQQQQQHRTMALCVCRNESYQTP
jgi:hypothetical protein